MLIKSSNNPYIGTFPRLIVIIFMLIGMVGFQSIHVVHAATILYVQPSGLTSGVCISWASACELQYALSLAVSGDEIWVATGMYYPTGEIDRSISFVLRNNISIFGGFSGTETLRSQRDPVVNVTTLSGDINTVGNISDNSYHVVNSSGTNSSAVLDGFTITGGNAVDDALNSYGGGILNISGSPTLSNLVIKANTAFYGGGVFNITNSSPVLANITISENSAERGGGVYNSLNSNPILINVTFNANTASHRGGGVANSGSAPTLINVTFSGNVSSLGGGMHNVTASNPILMNVTFSGNSASTDGGGIYNNENSNPIITNSILFGNTGGEIFSGNSVPVVTYSIVQGGHTGQGNLDADPLLGVLANNGGFTKTMALGAGSAAIDAGDDASCEATDQRGVTRPKGDHCDIGAFEYTNIAVNIAGGNWDNYYVPPQTGQRYGFVADDGPVQISNLESENILAALRVIWKEPGFRASYSEMMGLPAEQLSTEYWFPWYNNAVPASMDQGFRIGNVNITSTTIQIWVGNNPIDSFTLDPGASIRVGYPVDNGPIRIVCTDCTGSEKIIAAMRVIWKEPGVRFSYSEMMGLPKEQLSTEYWFPWYNNAVPASMDQGFRIANVSSTESNTMEVWVGNTKLDTITVGTGASTRVGYNVDNGPIKIRCTSCSNMGDDKIIAALRVIWKEPGFRASYSEMMGLPKEQLSSEYWFPWYNNAVPASMDQGFRIANVSPTESNTVEVWVGSTKLTTIFLAHGASTRVGYNVDNGPIRIVCTTCTNTNYDQVLAALRVIWKEPGFRASYSEMMGLPAQALSSEYWFPWYNNAVPSSMDQGFRISVP